MPILSSSVFDNTGNLYDVSRILTKDFLFDREAYKNYSRVYMPITYILSYGLQFAALTALVTHTACWHGKDIWRQWKRSRQEVVDEPKGSYEPVSSAEPSEENVPPLNANGKSRRHRDRMGSTNSGPELDNLMGGEDVHSRLMKRYEDAPNSWYLGTFVVMIAIGIFVVE
jgi:OPT oligopeptide transporter protein